jgi:hypothetical protein
MLARRGKKTWIPKLDAQPLFARMNQQRKTNIDATVAPEWADPG